LLHWFARLVQPVLTEENKSFLVLFFKKELLPSWGNPLRDTSTPMRR
jgi:hypothetical protein